MATQAGKARLHTNIVFFRPMKSDALAQATRPPALATLNAPTYAVVKPAVTMPGYRDAKISLIMNFADDITATPAEQLQARASHNK
jgi:hypothetical protein